MRRVAGVLPFEIRAWLVAASAVLVGSLASPPFITLFGPAHHHVEAPLINPFAPPPGSQASISLELGQIVNRERKAAREAMRAPKPATLTALEQAAAKLIASAVSKAGPGETGRAETGRASWYKIAAKTASGEDMDAAALTAAHRTLPIGTMVLVENLDNGRVVKVRINDRGPFTGNRIIDVSQAAAEELDMVADGVANVRVTRVPAVIAAGAGGTP
jgi:rare lipoprotein A